MGEFIIAGALIATLFGFGIGAIWYGFAEDYAGWPVSALGVVTVVFAIGVTFVVVEDATDDDPRISLKADQWVCTDSVTIMVPVMVGKITTMRAQERCVQYTKGDE